MTDQQSFIKRTIIAAFVILLIAGAFLLVIYAFHFFLLIFGSVLFAVLLRSGTNFLKEKINMPDGAALGLTTFLFTAIIVAIILLIIPTVSEQLEDIQESIPEAIESLKEDLEEYEWGRQLVEWIDEDAQGMIPDEQSLINRATGFFSSAISIISEFLILLVIGIFFAASPKLYQQGMVVLVAPSYRKRMEEVMDTLYLVLRSWLLGKFLTMIFVGIVSLIGLSILGVPMAAALAFIAFLLDFIPTLGPIIAFIPAGLVAFLDGPATALWVAVLYFVIQSIESYVLTPIIFKRTVSISPVMTLASLVLFGILAGPLGIILATPLIAVIQVLIRELYIKDYLENDLDESSENSFESRMKKVDE